MSTAGMTKERLDLLLEAMPSVEPSFVLVTEQMRASSREQDATELFRAFHVLWNQLRKEKKRLEKNATSPQW